MFYFRCCDISVTKIIAVKVTSIEYLDYMVIFFITIIIRLILIIN